MSKIIYIAGAMTDQQEFNHPAFFAKAKELEDAGYIVINPAVLPVGLRQEHYMDISAAMVRTADYLCMLDGWWQSKGAIAEYAQAVKLGHTIYDSTMKIIIDDEFNLVPKTAA